jgi:hypothetical protein
VFRVLGKYNFAAAEEVGDNSVFCKGALISEGTLARPQMNS